MENKKILLKVMRRWGNRVRNTEDFWQQWLRHDNVQERIDIYNELRWWRVGDIQMMLEFVCELWDKVQKYEREHPEKEKIKDLVEAGEKFDVVEFWMEK